MNTDDDISAAQTQALKDLAARHKHLFNDDKGCVREPKSDWLRIDVAPELEVEHRSRPAYPLSGRGRAAIDKEFDALTAAGRLEPVSKPTPHSMQVFVVYGKNGKERPVIDGRPLNALVAGDAYPVPRQEDCIAQVAGCHWLSSADITSCFNQRLLADETKHRAAVVTHRGHEMFNTVLMGFKTSVQHQQKLMDKAFKGIAWRFVCAYVDDILVYSRTFDEHLLHLDEVFRILSDLGITLKATKVYLGFHSIELLGFLVDRLGLTTTDAKSAAVQQMGFPKTLSEVEHFVGLSNWNRHLIPYYAQRIEPLQAYKTEALRSAPPTARGRKTFTARMQVPERFDLVAAFEDVRDALAAKPKLYHLRYDRPAYAYLDSSREYGTGLAVYQMDGDPEQSFSRTKLVPLHFLSKPITDAEKNYWPTDLEMSGLVWSVKKLRPYLEHVHVHFITDHKPNVDVFNMTGLATTSTARSNLRLQTWAIYLDNFKDRITVHYAKGKDLGCPDALSRFKSQVTEMASSEKMAASKLRDDTEMTEFEITEAFNGLTIEPTGTSVTEVTVDPEFESEIRNSYSTKQKEVIQTLSMEGTEHPDREGLKVLPLHVSFGEKSGILYFVPDDDSQPLRLLLPTMQLQRKALTLAHDASAHPGYLKTYLNLRSSVYWQGMTKSIRTYVQYCVECQKNKVIRHRPHGDISPIKSPHIPFDTVHIDLITDLPPCTFKGIRVDSIMTTTCRFSKAKRFTPGRKDWGAVPWAAAFYDDVVLQWGYPRTLVTDRDKRFLSKFWQEVTGKAAGVRCIATTAYHPSGDGLAERSNQELEIALRFFVDANQGDWPFHLHAIEAHFNNAVSEVTEKAPNEVIYGFKTRTALDLMMPENPLQTQAAIDFTERREVIRLEAADAIQIARQRMIRAAAKRYIKPKFDTGYAYINLSKHGFKLPSTRKGKLAQQRIGSFKILDHKLGKGNAMRLELPPTYGIHDVISVLHLEPAPRAEDDPFGRTPPEAVPEIIDGEEEWEVERILRKKGRGARTRYLVRWKMCTAEEDSWLPRSEFEHAQDLLKDFEETERQEES